MNNSFVSTEEGSPENSFDKIPRETQLKSVGQMFVHENKGQIKDLYKISSSIG
jgi:hypothetical protein